MSNIRLGANLFQKERVISDLQKENGDLKGRIQQVEFLNKQLEQEKAYFEKSDFESKNNLKILEIENQQLAYQNKQLKLELAQINEENQKKEDVVKEKTLKALYLQQDLEEVKTNNNIKTNKIENYQSEVNMQEKRNIKLEKMIESLNEKIEQKDNDIEILKKSIKSKDNHIAILLKEKQKAVLPPQQKENNFLKSNTVNKQDTQITMNSTSQSSMSSNSSVIKSEDNIRQLKNQVNSLTKQIQDKDAELKKAKDENFQLITRLKNAKK